jgi:hypothetical protein
MLMIMQIFAFGAEIKVSADAALIPRAQNWVHATSIAFDILMDYMRIIYFKVLDNCFDVFKRSQGLLI